LTFENNYKNTCSFNDVKQQGAQYCLSVFFF